MTPNRPYLLRGLYEWIIDNKMTPHIILNVERVNTDIPQEHIENGKIVLNIHPAAGTALGLFGHAHYLPLGKEKVFLFGTAGDKLPQWFKSNDWDSSVDFRTTNFLSEESDLGLTEREFGDFSITVSSPERAIMELLLLVPNFHTFEEDQS